MRRLLAHTPRAERRATFTGITRGASVPSLLLGLPRSGSSLLEYPIRLSLALSMA